MKQVFLVFAAFLISISSFSQSKHEKREIVGPDPSDTTAKNFEFSKKGQPKENLHPVRKDSAVDRSKFRVVGVWSVDEVERFQNWLLTEAQYYKPEYIKVKWAEFMARVQVMIDTSGGGISGIPGRVNISTDKPSKKKKK